MKCKKCKQNNWEIVIGYLLHEEGKAVHLWQCQTCMRVVSASDDDVNFFEGEV